MARNRKNLSLAARFGPALAAFLLCLLIGGVGVGYVWQVNQIYALGVEKKQCENKLKELQRQNKMHRDRLDYFRLPMVLEVRIKELKLGLGPPQPEQLLRLIEAPIPPPSFPNLAQNNEPKDQAGSGRTLR